MKDYTITFKFKKQICENTFAFYFDTNESGYSFKAGQYAYFTISDPKFNDVKGNSRPLSFASSPHIKDTIMVAARINSSVFINNLSALVPREKVFVSKPEGNLIPDTDVSKPLVFIAGGTGITPFRSIIEYLIHKNYKNKIYLFYSNKSLDQTPFFDEFEKWSGELDNFIFIPSFDETDNNNTDFESGIINEEKLEKYIPDLKDNFYFVSGPPGMVESVRNILLKNNVKSVNIRTE